MADPASSSSIIGLTSTIPVEILFAARLRPVDINNLFITSEKPERLIKQAESAGLPQNICAWIKGIYPVAINHDFKTIVAVTGGDCSNTVALTEILARRGIQVVTFDYPLSRDRGFH